jgi:hypothetical protein
MIAYLIGIIDFIHNNVERNTHLAVALNGAWAGSDALINGPASNTFLEVNAVERENALLRGMDRASEKTASTLPVGFF